MSSHMRRLLSLIALCLSVLLVAPACWSSEAAPSLEIVARDSFLPRVPVLVRLELRSPDDTLCHNVWDATATLSVEGDGASLDPAAPTVHLRNGIGSALVTIDAASDVTLRAQIDVLESSRELRLLSDTAITTVTETLAAGLTEWSGAVHVPDDLSVPAGSTLRLLPGTLVLMGSVPSGSGGADLNVEGTLESLGTAGSPVTFTAAGPNSPAEPQAGREWGEIHHDDSGESVYRHTILTLAGNSPGGGHTRTGPAIRAVDSRIVFENCSITNTAGKTMLGDGSDLEFRDCLLSRSVMGPEIEDTQLIFERSYIFEMFGDDDNDGIYLHDQRDGQIIRLSDCVVGAGDDDAIDTLGSDVTIERCIVRDFADKGISVFHDEVWISGCLVVDNDIGVSCKTDDDAEAIVNIEHCTIVGNRVGIEARNKGGDDPDALIYYHVRDSIIRHGPDGEPHTVRTDYEDSFIEINYSNLTPLPDDWGGIGNEGNLFESPRFIEVDDRDLRLQPDSPCIDAGDPDTVPDPDGSRSDMGALPFVTADGPMFRRGDVNGDRVLDVADPISILLFLFGGRAVVCVDAADTDDNGDSEVTDAIALLAYLFTGGAPLPAPFAACGVDATEDALDCSDEAGCP